MKDLFDMTMDMAYGGIFELDSEPIAPEIAAMHEKDDDGTILYTPKQKDRR